jgi:Ca2+-binding RTX toxin-like protein
MVHIAPKFTPRVQDDYIVFGAEATGAIPAGAQITLRYYFDTEGSFRESFTAPQASNSLLFTARVDLIDWLIGGSITYTAPGQDTITYKVAFDGFDGGDGAIDMYLPSNGNGNTSLGTEDDFYYGGGGNDRVRSGPGADYMDGGSGSDTLDYFVPNDFGGSGVYIDLGKNIASGGDAEGDVIRNFERALGTMFNDTLKGTSGSNLLKGYIGNDSLYGGSGNDELDGGYGSDRIEGQSGADILIGGGNARDTYVFRYLADSNRQTRDTITEFNKDIIHLSYIDADTTADGNQAFHFIGSGPFTGDAGELRLSVNTAGNYLIVYGDVDGNQSADFAVKVLGVTTLAESDFAL